MKQGTGPGCMLHHSALVAPSGLESLRAGAVWLDPGGDERLPRTEKALTTSTQYFV